jgi:hypothetical protein
MAATKITTNQIPVIDLSGPEEAVSKELVHAAATYGFVYIKSLGKDIPLESIDGTFTLVMRKQMTWCESILIFHSQRSFSHLL